MNKPTFACSQVCDAIAPENTMKPVTVQPLGSNVFTGGINNVHAGDVLKMSVEIDPSKSSEYEAGTMELTATVG